jgi:UDP-3-O-[3-hydroxymyristoyl] N-acetylglucosamine deacetylase/3-hydroxyacyl-[acyl-carrier-protein] dehydratase
MTIQFQRTLADAREIEGVGLHTGHPVRLKILPAEANSGIRFQRVDLDGKPEIPATVASVVDYDRGTTLAVGDAQVRTVEHLLSALTGAGVDNARIELDGPEPPAGDGSALIFGDLIRSAGVVEQAEAAKFLEVKKVVTVEAGGSRYVVSPASDFEVSATIRFDHPLIGRQFYSHSLEPVRYQVDVESARTFGFLNEVEELRRRGLAQGGSLDNAIVLTEDGLHDGVALRFPDEFARHKVLDVVGDLSLVGARIRGHVVADRPSHGGNIALAKQLMAESTAGGASRPRMDIQQILQYLPHRYPILLVDRILEFEERKRIVGLKNVTINEPFFAGHFPGHPIMPGVLIIEAMAQVGGLLLMDAIENPESKIVLFMALDNVKWRRPVTPGDQIRFEVEVLQIRGRTARMKGLGLVDGQVVAEAEMMARVGDR